MIITDAKSAMEFVLSWSKESTSRQLWHIKEAVRSQTLCANYCARKKAMQAETGHLAAIEVLADRLTHLEERPQ
jgi:hypothetical protein